MSYFADADEVYATLGELIEETLADEELGPLFSRADSVIRWVYTDPDAQITLELHEGTPGHVKFGSSDLVPEVTMTMEADVAHRFWLGEVNVAVALTRGQIKASGPVDKILRLVPIAARAFPRYRRLTAAREQHTGSSSAAAAGDAAATV